LPRGQPSPHPQSMNLYKDDHTGHLVWYRCSNNPERSSSARCYPWQGLGRPQNDFSTWDGYVVKGLALLHGRHKKAVHTVPSFSFCPFLLISIADVCPVHMTPSAHMPPFI
jgi:hypothetical protein